MLGVDVVYIVTMDLCHCPNHNVVYQGVAMLIIKVANCVYGMT